MENEKNSKRTAADYAGKLEELKQSRNEEWYLIIHGKYKAALGQIILNEFLDGTNDRPEQFTRQDILTAIRQAGGRTFRDYEYDGHRWDPNGNFVDELLDGCIRHDRRVEKSNDVYRRKIFDTLKDKKEENTRKEE